MLENILRLLEDIAHTINTNPSLAADKMDAIADVIKEYANNLRNSVKGHAPTSPGGLGDSCRMKVSGPDGIIKQDILIKG